MKEQQTSYEQFLHRLPPERRGEVEQVWRAVRESIPAGYREEITPKFLTYKADDEWYIALANQKNYLSLYLMPLYVYPESKAKLEAGDKKVKAGKSCINFRRADELPLGLVREIVGAHGAADFLEQVRKAKRAKT